MTKELKQELILFIKMVIGKNAYHYYQIKERAFEMLNKINSLNPPEAGAVGSNEHQNKICPVCNGNGLPPAFLAWRYDKCYNCNGKGQID